MDAFTLRAVGFEHQTVCAGQVIGYRNDLLFIKITQNFEELFVCYDKEGQFFNINFIKNRLVYQVLLNALEWIKRHGLHSVLINNTKYDQVDYSITRENEQKFSCAYSETLNDEQKCAVQHIVWGKNHTIPILLHGPPGTGKTRTLVASIAEIVLGTTDNVLILAHSNAACDEIMMRLLEVLEPSYLFRLYAKSWKKESVNAKIMPNCNFYKSEFCFPSWEYLKRFRVLITTLLTSGCLVRSRGQDPDFDSGHYSRVFLDEAGCVHEPASMVPIAGTYVY